jgi:pyridinium-3,5-bisthiocarboxylic acid mononucleotide nickel chelatase
VTILETNIDDLNPEILGAFMEKALRAGALDVFHTAIQMKKSRPGVMLSVLCEAKEADALTELLLRETSAFGVRRYNAERRKLKREFVKVQAAYGEVTVKLGKLDGKVVQAAPEYESCKVLAEKSQAPLKAIYEAAMKAVSG